MHGPQWCSTYHGPSKGRKLLCDTSNIGFCGATYIYPLPLGHHIPPLGARGLSPMGSFNDFPKNNPGAIDPC